MDFNIFGWVSMGFDRFKWILTYLENDGNSPFSRGTWGTSTNYP
jgi:hypothetical protein